MDKTSDYIYQLVEYGIQTGLLEREDKTYSINQLMELFELDAYNEQAKEYKKENELVKILAGLLEIAKEKGILKEDSIVQKDLLDTKMMGLLTPRPSEVTKKFWDLYDKSSPVKATEYFYKLSIDSNYIRKDRIEKDKKWKVSTLYGDLDITINLSKPEKDPRVIAEAKTKKQSGYPKCLLCIQNEGYAGNIHSPARQNHRIIPITINNEAWGFQYSPYVYYNEHCIVLNTEHIPMKMDRDTFAKLLDFTNKFPHYFVGSNAELPIVGGSILTHEHFQGGNYEFAMARAPLSQVFQIKGFEDVQAGIVKWPMSVIRICANDLEHLSELADKILNKWRNYTDESVFVYAFTDGESHNTITPIARKRDGLFELDLVLRNNITTAEDPFGVYHPHENLHHIKKENIGLIEVMGLAVLPSRLKEEMEILKKAILAGENIRSEGCIEKHADWAEEFCTRYDKINESNIDAIIEKEIGMVFLNVLEDAGVYKRNNEGQDAFMRFIQSIDESSK